MHRLLFGRDETDHRSFPGRDRVRAHPFYKARIGAYPPDNPGNAVTNQLYYELQGMIFNQGKGGFTTLDGSVTLTPANLAAAYGPNVTGFMNASGTSRNSDETSSAVNFLKTGLRPNQVSLLSNGANLLVCSVPWESPDPTNVIVPSPPAPPFPKINPWRYVSTNPTNNPGRYDLWVDLYLRGKIYRVNNWSKEPLLVNP